jgi:hypothetical protein
MAEPNVRAPIDANGNMTADGTRTFEWDARDQLNSLEAGTLSVEYAYDGLRRRIVQLGWWIRLAYSPSRSDPRVQWPRCRVLRARAVW